METMIEAKTIARFDKRQDRIVRDMGWGDTAGAVGLTKAYLQPLSKALETQLAQAHKLNGNDPVRHLLRTIRPLAIDVLSLCALQSTLHAVATGCNYRETCLELGHALQSECWAAGLLRHDSKLAAKIAKAAKRSNGKLSYRRQAARSLAKRSGFELARWARADVVYAGHWLLSALLEALPLVFTVSEDNFVTITEGALAQALRAVDVSVANSPMFLPMQTPPVPWTGWNEGGYGDTRFKARNAIVRTHHKETVAAIRSAIANGKMQPALDALNTMQGVAWRINEPVLNVMRDCYERCIPVKGLPRKLDIAKPDRPEAWEVMSEDAQRLWRTKAAQVNARNRGFVGERILFAEDTTTAALLVGGPFWTPCNLDWRGRVYPMSHFNFQRDDRVRALFMFDEGAPIGEEGLYWLKVHVANTGDFGKVSKRPMEERVAWVDEHLDEITAMAAHPMGRAHLWWMDADKPFLFLAACLELVAALSATGSYITRLPVSFDGSCSGLQHLCAMTRAEEGCLVNLTDGELPQDVYEVVAKAARERIEADTANPELAAMCLAYGVDRKLVKRNVMTYSYSSKKFGMAQQHMEDLMRPLEFSVLEGARDVHPFASSLDVRTLKDGTVSKSKDGNAASKYLAGHVYAAIEETVQKPAQAMAMLQSLARTLAHEGKPLEWTTPVGIPWSNRYHTPQTRKLTLWMRDVAIQVRLSVGAEKEIDKDRSANGVAPNFVHALDAAHLMLTVNAAAAEGMTQVATVHDSFGCLAPYARRFNAVIREQFAGMYDQHDVLSEVMERASCDLTLHNRDRLPERVDYGSLNIMEVLNARYAFA
jgi:DNA-directed RNA polymerase